MNELQIEYFMAVAECRSFKKAAEERFVSQPAISRQIASLEEEVGFPLFARGRKETLLTEAGRVLAEYFTQRNTEMESVIRHARNVHHQGAASLRIATGKLWALDTVLAPVMPGIYKEFPDAQLVIENHSFDEHGYLLNENKADIIIGMPYDVRPTQATIIRPFATIQRHIAYSRRHRLASKRDLKPVDFKDEVFFFPVMYEKTFVKNMIKSCLEPYGFLPRFYAVSNDESMLSCVYNGFGVAMIDSWVYEPRRQILKVVNLDTHFETSIAWKKNNPNPILELFLTLIEQDRPGV